MFSITKKSRAKKKIKKAMSNLRVNTSLEIFVKEVDESVKAAAVKYELDPEKLTKRCEKLSVNACLQFENILEKAEKIHDSVDSYNEAFNKIEEEVKTQAAVNEINSSAIMGFANKWLNPAEILRRRKARKEQKAKEQPNSEHSRSGATHEGSPGFAGAT